MTNPIEKLSKTFDSRIRIGIMSILMAKDRVSFNQFKTLLKLSDGNVATHMKTLEDHKYITVRKSFVGRRPNTTYTMTKSGEKAFREHMEGLEEIIRAIK